MEAQLLVVYQNGVEEARDLNRRGITERIDVEKSEDIKGLVWKHLLQVKRNGHVLVKWKDNLYICEMKQDLKSYFRTEIPYHPLKRQFSI